MCLSQLFQKYYFIICLLYGVCNNIKHPVRKKCFHLPHLYDHYTLSSFYNQYIPNHKRSQIVTGQYSVQHKLDEKQNRIWSNVKVLPVGQACSVSGPLDNFYKLLRARLDQLFGWPLKQDLSLAKRLLWPFCLGELCPKFRHHFHHWNSHWHLKFHHQNYRHWMSQNLMNLNHYNLIWAFFLNYEQNR